MYLVLEHLLIVIGVSLVALAIILALQQRRSPQASAAWILFIILVPYVAVPVFLVLGFRKSGRRFPPIRFAVAPDSIVATPNRSQTLFHRLGGAPAQTGNRIAFHASPETALAALEAVVSSAEERLDVQLYILSADASGRRFLALLVQRLQAGVKVRLSIDALGSWRKPQRDLREFIRAGGELRRFSPLLHWFGSGSINLRNHRKIVIADQARVWAGGRNVGDPYLVAPAANAAQRSWHDLSFSVEGPVVTAFTATFDSDWDVTGAPIRVPPALCPPVGDAVLQFVPAGPDEPLDVLHDGLVNAIQRARMRIWIATPYFIPTEALMLALATAARGGVEVRILIPDRSNQWSADLARGPYLRELAQAGCQMLRFQPGMLHAKAWVIDDIAWVGSANFDVRSMQLNFELGLVAYDPTTVSEIIQWYQACARDSLGGLRHASLPRRLVESIFRLESPIL